MNIISRIKELAEEYHEEITGIRRHIHKNPELSFREKETSKYVQSQLDKIGIPYKPGYVETGIVAHIKGRNPEGRTIALRADMDALPILEENEVEYRSANKGVMHACGHDVHTASLLGAAKILHSLKDEFEGTIKLIFQPGEEKLPGGASLMVKENALKNPDAESIYGQHVYPNLPAGKVGFRKGMYMASCDEIYVTVKGEGGHAALPHFLVDPVLITSHLIVALQQIVSRNMKPDIPAVLSFGKVEANGATNVIPNEVKLEGTFRTFDEKWRKDMHVRMKSLAEGLARSMGGSCEFQIDVGYPYLVNDEERTERAKASAVEFLGADNVVDLDLRMTAEDFSYFSQEVPACFYRMGTASKDGSNSAGLHTPNFDIDETALKTGMGLMSYIALNELNTKTGN